MDKFWTLDLMKRVVLSVILGGLLVMGFQNCGNFDALNDGDRSSIGKLNVSYEQFEKVVETNCNHCHGGADSLSPGTINFSSLNNEAAWLNHPERLIVPGSRAQSAMYYRLVHAAGKVPSKKNNMPFAAEGYPVLMTDDDAETIGGYIDTLGNGTPSKIVDKSTGYSALAKAKFLVNGQAATGAEVSSIVAPDDSLNRPQLKAQITQWLETPEAKDKLVKFFRLTLNQEDWTYPADGNELLGRIREQGNGNNQNSNRNAWEENLKESFARTALKLVEDGRPFSDIVTTTERVVTSAVLSTLSFADGAGSGNVDENTNTFNAHLDGLGANDFNDWRVVNLQQGNGAINFDDMAAIRQVGAGGNYALRIPRIGFFNTLAFQLKFPTNDGNDFRVTASEMLIVAVDEIFEAGDPTPNGNTASVTAEHVDPATDCYRCHRLMDPIRETFKASYDHFYKFDNSAELQSPNFNFAGHSGASNTISQMAQTVAAHPLFANGWASKLCAYANSEPCDVNHPEFSVLVSAFEASNLDFKTLLAEVMSSPMVTAKGGGDEQATEATVADANSGLISVTRRGHLCHALNTRYRQVLGSQNLAYNLNNPNLCELNGAIISAASGIGEAGTTRGEAGISQSSIPSAFSVQSLEQMCRLLSEEIVGDGTVGFNGSNVASSTAATKDMVNYMMGMPDNHPRFPSSKKTLDDIYNYGVGTVNLNSEDALKEAFVFACSSPDIAGVGL